jgi:hypothetical protein
MERPSPITGPCLGKQPNKAGRGRKPFLQFTKDLSFRTTQVKKVMRRHFRTLNISQK